ncbi:MucB/RseB C-terminal domain-containing protein [Pseudomonadota bacterium]
MIARAATLLMVAALVFPVTHLGAGDHDTPRQMLERMTAAMSQMSYQGTFVYVQGNVVETMRITHVSDEAGIREHLVAVSGPPREVIRDSNGVRWVLADDESVFEDAGFNRTFFPELPIDQHDQTESSYQMKRGGAARIAGHQARNLKILPKDEFRYGYSLWLEEQSGLLMKWELIDGKNNVLAKLMFTDVRLGSEVDKSELKPASQLKKFKTVASGLPSGRSSGKSVPRWQPDQLPPGFELAMHRSLQKQDDGIYEHMVYSDGLAAVSVYIESGEVTDDMPVEVRKIGTTHALTRSAGDMLITVVGDVPAVTVQMIGDGIEISSP